MIDQIQSKNGVSIRLTDERWAHITEEHCELAGLRCHEEADMAITDFQEYLRLIPAVNRSPQHAVWLSYDTEADTLYVNFKKPSYATNSELTEEDIIVRYEGETVIGFTVLHAGKRSSKTA